MGYTLTIGNAIPKKNIDDDWAEFTWEVEDIYHENGPSFGNPTDGSNALWPSYSAWALVSGTPGFDELFQDDGMALIRHHPGIVPLLPIHKEKIDAAFEKFKQDHPKQEAEYDGSAEGAILCRITWMKYWVDWALANCENPAFENG